MYEQAQAAQGGAQAGPDMNAGAGSSSSDDVVDGDYKESLIKKRLIRKV